MFSYFQSFCIQSIFSLGTACTSKISDNIWHRKVLTSINIWHYLDMSKINHITLINIGTYVTIFGLVLNEFVQNCSIIHYIVKYPTIPNNIISLHCMLFWNFLDYEKLNCASYRGGLYNIWYYWKIFHYIRQYLASIDVLISSTIPNNIVSLLLISWKLCFF